MTVDMLMRGTRTLSRQQIKDRLDSLKAKLSISGGPTQLNATIETTRPSLPAVLQLLGSVLRSRRSTRRSSRRCGRKTSRHWSSSARTRSPWARRAYNRTTNPWPKGHPRYTADLR